MIRDRLALLAIAVAAWLARDMVAFRWARKTALSRRDRRWEELWMKAVVWRGGSPKSRGFTVVEAMIIVAIAGILAAAVLPGYLRWRAGEPLIRGAYTTSREQVDCEKRGGFWEIDYDRHRIAIGYRCAQPRATTAEKQEH